MSGERTPNMLTIRRGWVSGHPFPLTTEPEEREAEFDRALATHDARIASEAAEGALRDAADEMWDWGTDSETLGAVAWLRTRADRLAAEREGD